MEEINKLLSGKGKEIATIFFWDWYSLKEASKIYNPKLSGKSRNQRTVAYYFYKFKELHLLEEREITKKVSRKTAKGKDSIYPSKCLRYRLNFEPFYLYCREKKIEFTEEEEKIVSQNLENVRLDILGESYYDNVIQAILKYYIKHYATSTDIFEKRTKKFITIAEQRVENKSKESEELKKQFPLDNKKIMDIEFRLYKRMGLLSTPKRTKKELKKITEWNSILKWEVKIINYEKNPKLNLSINKKFRQVMGIEYL